MKIEKLLGRTEGPNTFWAETDWASIEEAREKFPTVVYREVNGTVEQLLAYSEGENTFWEESPVIIDITDFVLWNFVDSKRVFRITGTQKELTPDFYLSYFN